MIPKIIHYCWFGGKDKTKAVIRCIDSWKKYLPDYEIIEWNESNTEITISPYVEKAYMDKKWAFLTDYLRLYIVYNYGGVYFDTDVEVIKSIDDVLFQEYYLACERDGIINTGLGFGAEKGNQIIWALLKEYDNRFGSEIMDTIEYVRCPEMNTNAIIKLFGNESVPGTEIVKQQGGSIYPSEYFCPIHHFDGSWLSPEAKIKREIKSWLKRVFYKVKN